jgi:hypothetical protein
MKEMTRLSPLSLPFIGLCALLVGCGKPDSQAPSSASPSAVSAAVSGVPFEPRADWSLSAIQASALVGTCSVENVVALSDMTPQTAVDNTYTATSGSSVKLIGFAADTQKGQPLGRFSILLAGAQVFAVNATTTFDRPDVAEYFKKPSLLQSGFQIDVQLQGIPPGDYSFFMSKPDGPVCPTHFKLRVVA